MPPNQLSLLLFVALLLVTPPVSTSVTVAIPHPLTPTKEANASTWQEIPMPRTMSYEGEQLTLRRDEQEVGEGGKRSI